MGVKGLHLGVGSGRKTRVTGGIGPFRYYRSIGASSSRSSSRDVPQIGGCINTLAKGTVLIVGCVLVYGLVKGTSNPLSGHSLQIDQPAPDHRAFTPTQTASAPTKQGDSAAGTVSTPPMMAHAAHDPAANGVAPPASITSHFEPSFADQVRASQQLAIQKYPDVGRAGTPLNRLFVHEYDRQRLAGSLRLTKGTWPLWLADQCQARILNPKLPAIAVDAPPNTNFGSDDSTMLPATDVSTVESDVTTPVESGVTARPSAGSTHVQGYRRKDGTWVDGYDRRNH